MKLKCKIADYRKRLNEVDDIGLSKDRFIAAVKRFMAMDYQSAPLLREPIERIDVYEATIYN